MTNYPNIFDFASKELTQDAMLSWFLECLRSTDNTIKAIGKQFLKEFVFNNSISIEEADLIECSRQYHKMDIYARVLINRKFIYPIIFEDKTSTFLHSNQLERYCNMVYGWFWNDPENAIHSQMADIESRGIVCEQQVQVCNIQYVLFKTSYIFDWEKKEFKTRIESFCNNEYYTEDSKKYIPADRAEAIAKHTDFHIRNLSDMLKYLKSISSDNVLITDYLKFINEKIEREDFDSNWEKWKDSREGFEIALNSHLGQWQFFKACGAEEINCQSNSGIWSAAIQ